MTGAFQDVPEPLNSPNGLWAPLDDLTAAGGYCSIPN
jgi:hypothetical protein